MPALTAYKRLGNENKQLFRCVGIKLEELVIKLPGDRNLCQRNSQLRGCLVFSVLGQIPIIKIFFFSTVKGLNLANGLHLPA